MATSDFFHRRAEFLRIRRSDAWMHFRIRVAVLKTIFRHTGSQWNPRSIGVLWSRRRAADTRRAAVSCTDCSRCMSSFVRCSVPVVLVERCSSPTDSVWTLASVISKHLVSSRRSTIMEQQSFVDPTDSPVYDAREQCHSAICESNAF